MIYDLTNIVDVANIKIDLRKHIEKGLKVELKKIQKKRSLTINRYLHVCISIFAIEFGLTLEEAKTLLKRKCDFMIYEKNGIKFLRKTSKLDNLECSKFVEFIRNYASKQGLYIPDASEYKLKSFEIDKEISKHKEYL